MSERSGDLQQQLHTCMRFAFLFCFDVGNFDDFAESVAAADFVLVVGTNMR